MINREELARLINLTREFSGYLSLGYIPSKCLYSTDMLYELYYGSEDKIQIGSYYVHKAKATKITDDNIDNIICEVYDILNDSISEEIHQAIKNLDMEYEDLKYFDREKEKYEKFKQEVLNLLNEKKIFGGLNNL